VTLYEGYANCEGAVNFEAVRAFFKPVTDEQVRALAREHAGTPGVKQSIYQDEVGLQELALVVCAAGHVR
jgi:hypothetical protein